MLILYLAQKKLDEEKAADVLRLKYITSTKRWEHAVNSYIMLTVTLGAIDLNFF